MLFPRAILRYVELILQQPAIVDTPVLNLSACALQVMLPSELMYELHVIDGVPEDAVKQALEQCFARTAVFKQEILATVLQRMVEMSPLPKLFLWTVIETVTHHQKLKSFISQSILRRLVERELWESHMLWEAFEVRSTTRAVF